MSRPHVAVIGAGLGGLALAQGLRRGGVPVSVYERDASLTARRQGYRLHVDSRAGLALRECLPPMILGTVLATTGQRSRAFTVLDKRLRVRFRQESTVDVDPDDPATLSTSVNRSTLREALATGLDVHWGHELASFDDRGDEVVARFTNGSSITAGVLVGADGVNSAVRRQYLPHARVVDTGGRIIYGRTTLDGATLPLVPPAVRDGITAIIGGRVGIATGLVQFRRPPAELGLSPVDDYMMWAVSGPLDVDPTADQAALQTWVARRLRGWHPDLLALIARGDPAQIFLIQVRTAEPVPAWTPTRVTVLGDAIHAMSPARGSGANTALQDAALLSRSLVGADDPVTAIGSYEEQLREYGFAAVAASKAAEATTAARRYPLLRWLPRRP